MYYHQPVNVISWRLSYRVWSPTLSTNNKIHRTPVPVQTSSLGDHIDKYISSNLSVRHKKHCNPCKIKYHVSISCVDLAVGLAKTIYVELGENTYMYVPYDFVGVDWHNIECLMQAILLVVSSIYYDII